MATNPTPSSTLTADDIIETLGLQPHPEGGHYVETFRDTAGGAARAQSTAIYFLLKSGERSHWHKVDAAEVWHYHAGAALRLKISEPGKEIEEHFLGTDLPSGERPQVIVSRQAWQTAEPMGDWTLVSCTVSPGFEFSGFELAPPGWTPT